MKRLFIIGIVASFSACYSQKSQKTTVSQNNYISYSQSFDSSTVNFTKYRYYLSVQYSGDEKKDCHIGFRVYMGTDTSQMDTDLKSNNYIGSYFTGEDCHDNFLIPLNEKIKKMNSSYLFVKLVFRIIPIDVNGGILSVDLRKNFHLTVKVIP